MTLRAGLFDAGGAPLAGGRLALVSPKHAHSQPSGSDGSVELVLDDPDLRFQLGVRVEREGYASRFEEVFFEAGRVVHLGNFRLETGGAISGRVLDRDGRGVPEALITTGDKDAERDDLERMRFELYPDLTTAVRSGPDGSFLLQGVPEGFHRLWASGAGWIASYSAPVEVRSGQESTGLELTLEPFTSAFEVTGTVRDPNGLAVPHADVRYRKVHGGSSMSGSTTADELGRFRFVVAPNQRLSLTASHPEELYGPASLDGLTGGASDLVLRLGELRSTTLAVTGDEGRPLVEFSWRTLGDADGAHLASGQEGEHGDGLAALRAPSVPFRIEVWAPGHTLESIGPLMPESVGPRIDVRLRALPGLRGRVLADGEPVAGARVLLVAGLAEDIYVAHNGFQVFLETSASDEAASDDDGRFLLTPRRSGTWYVRAEAAGFAPAELGPLALDPGRSHDELEVELGEGGAIAGRVLVAPGPDAGGRIVGISRGDCNARTQRAAPDGSFRFEHLTPGPWQVRVVDEEIHPSRTMTSSSTGRGRAELEYDCRVEEGRTTRFDIDLTGRGGVRVVGLLRLDGAPPGVWRAMLTEDGLLGGSSFDEAKLDVDGGFTLLAPKPGRYRVVLQGMVGEGGSFVVATVELAQGENPWQLDIQTGALEVRNVPPSADLGNPTHMHVGLESENLMCVTALAPDANGVCLLPRVPVGPGRIVEIGDRPRELDSWRTLAECEVARGLTAHVTLP
ncbi:MAG TPA: carboxypeptidase-like regulatory domain-containing protein [Planctomycetota bacterium]|nr:carboxypeptidase-like regulatory domain-containing protein [Planctomycetota bacterium]